MPSSLLHTALYRIAAMSCTSIILLMCFSYQAWGQSSLLLQTTEGSNYYNAGKYLKVLADTNSTWVLMDAEHSFKKHPSFTFKTAPAGHAVYWGEVSITVETPGEYLLNLGTAQSIQAWLIGEQGAVIQREHTGTWIPLEERSVKSTRLSIMGINFPKKGEYRLYIRWDLKKPQVMTRFSLRVYPATAWHKDNRKLKVLQGMFQGVMLIFFLYNLAKYFTNRDKSFLYYSLFVLFFDGYHLFFYGLGLEYLYSNTPKLDEYVWLISTHTASIFYIYFIKWFCNLPTEYPRMWKWARAYAIIKVLETVGVVLLHIVYTDYDLLDTIQRFLFLAEEIALVTFMIILWKHQNPLHRYLVVGTIVFALSICLSIIAPYIWSWNPYYYPLIMQGGTLFKVFIFSMGLGYRSQLYSLKQQQLQQELILQLQNNENIKDALNQQLETQVLLRTEELTRKNIEIFEQHRNIEVQNKQLKLLNEEQNNLMKIVAHDLKSPLNRIEGMMSVFKLSMGKDAHTYEDYFNIITQSITSQKTLISRVLSSENAKGVTIHLERLNLTHTFSSLFRLFGPVAMNKQVNLNISLPKNEVLLYTDDTLITAIVDNLLSNAVKFSMPHKTVSLALEDRETHISIIIADEGPGFTEEDQKKIFTRYQKLSAQPTGNEDSTGLGLSIVKQYTEILGGSIKYDTKEGVGTTFTLVFNK